MKSIKKYVSLVLAAAIALTGVNYTPAKADTAKYETKEVTIAASSAAVTTTVAVNANVKKDDSLVAVVSPAATTVIEKADAKAVSDGAVEVTFTVAKDATPESVVINVAKKGAEKTEVTTSSAVSGGSVVTVDEKDILAAVKVNITGESSNVKKTKKINVKSETPVYVKKNGKTTIKVTRTKAADASEAAALKATIKNKKVVKSVKISGNKVTINAAKKATKGASTVVTLKSSGAKNVQVKVFVINTAKKITVKKANATVKKKKTVKVTYTVKAENKKQKVADKVTVKYSKKNIVNVKKTALKKGKVVVTFKGLKKGTTKATVKIGSKKAKAVKITVK